MSPPRLLPTHFLPPLPSQSRNTLSPLVRERLSECITSLRGMIVSPVLISGDVVNESPARSTQGKVPHSYTGAQDHDTEEDDELFLSDFERSWAERWLNGVITRGEGWLVEVEPEEEDVASGEDLLPTDGNGEEEDNLPEWEEYLAREQVLQEASELLSLMVCCTGAGAIMREITFPTPESPTTTRRSLPSSPKARRRRSTLSTPPSITLKMHDAAIDDHTAVGVQTWGSCILLGRMMAAEPVRFFDLACVPASTDKESARRPLRLLELGAGTGLLSMLCHEIINKRNLVSIGATGAQTAEIIATDYHPLVLDNMRKCIALNFPDDTLLDLEDLDMRPTSSLAGLGVMPLDWLSFPQMAERYHRSSRSPESSQIITSSSAIDNAAAARKDLKISPYADNSMWKPTGEDASLACANDAEGSSGTLSPSLAAPFDMILAADCVYDTAHAGMIRDCVKWSLCLPEVDDSGNIVREGGVLVSLSTFLGNSPGRRHDKLSVFLLHPLQHLLSPLRPTYAEETISIARAFPFIDALPSRQRRAACRHAPKFNRDQGTYSSGVATPVTPMGHKASGIDAILELDKLRFDKSKSRTKYLVDSGMATPTPPESEMAKGAGLAVDKWVDEFDMGLGEAGGWVLCTKRRVELERMKGNGRSDEVEYWWWEIGWA
ncbi:hypothetical protein QFC21_003851 [Naganishia friedmannii]|uniref:Uncharacterized protein n=1 Tax=Naganishia friedmannii TaxID=89922 RepID=A0ACC2VKB8_9TREE|nr:hypothetical protein QFC21_003851 [Naganishia friedmannii]